MGTVISVSIRVVKYTYKCIFCIMYLYSYIQFSPSATEDMPRIRERYIMIDMLLPYQNTPPKSDRDDEFPAA
eukprot:COSAG05_NODE_1226_length_5453_cov_6.202279_1_plen_71_part_10